MVACRPKYPPPGRPARRVRVAGRIACTAACMAACGASPAAWADGWSGAVGIASDKVYRGLSQTGGRPSASVDIAWRGDTGPVAGAGLANVRDERGRTLAELTLSAGHGWQLGDDWTTSLGLVHYAYPGSAQRAYADYDELAATAVWRGRAVAMVALSPNTVGYTAAGERVRGRTLAAELSWQQPLAGRFTLDAGLGHFDLHAIGGTSYRYGSANLGWADGPSAAYLGIIVGRDIPGAPSVGGRRWVASALWRF